MKRIITLLSVLSLTLSFSQVKLNYVVTNTTPFSNPVDSINLGEVLVGEKDSIIITVINQSTKVFFLSNNYSFSERIIAGQNIPASGDEYCKVETGFELNSNSITLMPNDTAILNLVFEAKTEYQFGKYNSSFTSCVNEPFTQDASGYHKIPFAVMLQSNNFGDNKSFPFIVEVNNVDMLTSTENIEDVNYGEVIKAFNLQGQEVPTNTKGEVIILQYDNGSREKVFIQD